MHLSFHKQKPHRKRNIIIGSALGVVVLLLGGVAFIKLAPTTAANFTDAVLRPIFGPTTVVSVEKVFFNIQDKVQGVTAKYKTETSPLLGGGQVAKQTQGGDLSLHPIPVNPVFPKVAGEGVWLNHPLSLFPKQEVAAYTFIRPDLNRSFAFTTIVQLDMRKLRMNAVAGKQQPGGPIKQFGTGVIPTGVIDSGSLVAAFDGGFQYRDGQYGMIVGSTTILPLQKNLATLVGYTDGTLKLINYTGQSLGSNVAFVRQNCPMLVQNGQNAVLDQINKKLWGRTLSTGMYTWRSGIGLTKNGDLLFAVGNNLTPSTLADALILAGAQSAMQLDINPGWVRFNFFEPSGSGTYSTSTLTKGLKDGSSQYLNGYNKDFFYLTKAQ